MKIKLSLAAVLTCSVVYANTQCVPTNHNFLDNLEGGIWGILTGQGHDVLQNPYPYRFIENMSKLSYYRGDPGWAWRNQPFKANQDVSENSAFCNGYFVWSIGPAIVGGKVEFSVADLLYSPGYAYTLAYDGYQNGTQIVADVGSYDALEDGRKVRCGKDANWDKLNPGNNCKNPLFAQENIGSVELENRRGVDSVNIIPYYTDINSNSDLYLYYDRKIVEKYGSLVYKAYGLRGSGYYKDCFIGNSHTRTLNGCDYSISYNQGHLAKFLTLDYGYKTKNANNTKRLVELQVKANHKGDEKLKSNKIVELDGVVMKQNDTELTEDIYRLQKPKEFSTGVIDTYVTSTNNKGLTYFITQDVAIPTDKGQYLETLVKNARNNSDYFRKKHSGKKDYIGNINASEYISSDKGDSIKKDHIAGIQVDFDTLGILAPKYFESVFFKLPNKSTGVTQGYDGAYKTDVYVQHSDWLNRYITGFGTTKDLDRTKVDSKTSVYDGGWMNHRYLKNPSNITYKNVRVGNNIYWESDIKEFGLAYDMYDPITTFIPNDPAYGVFSGDKSFVYKQYAIDDANDTYVDLHIRPLFAQVKSDGNGGYIAEHQNNINKSFGNGGFNYTIKYVFYPDPNKAIGYRKPDIYEPTIGEKGEVALLTDGSIYGIPDAAKTICQNASLTECKGALPNYAQGGKWDNVVDRGGKETGRACTYMVDPKYYNMVGNDNFDYVTGKVSYNDLVRKYGEIKYVLVCSGGYLDTQKDLNKVTASMTETTFNEIKGLDKNGNAVKNSKGAPILKLMVNDDFAPARKIPSSCYGFDRIEDCIKSGEIMTYRTNIDIISATYKGAYITNAKTNHYLSVTKGSEKGTSTFGDFYNANRITTGFLGRAEGYIQDYAHINNNLSSVEKNNENIMKTLLGKRNIEIVYENGIYVGYLKLGSELNNFIQEDDSALVLEGNLGNILDDKTGRIVHLGSTIKIIIKGHNNPVTPDVAIITLKENGGELDTIATQVNNKVVNKDNPSKSTTFRFKQDFGVDKNPNSGQYVKIILQKKIQNDSNGGWGKGEDLGNVYFPSKCVDATRAECSNTTNEVINSSKVPNEADRLKGFNKADEKISNFNLDDFKGFKGSVVYNKGHSSNDLGVGVYRFAIVYDYVNSSSPSEPIYSDEFTIRPEYVSMKLVKDGSDLSTKGIEANRNYATSNIKSSSISQQGSMKFDTEFSFEDGVKTKDLELLNKKDLNEFYYVVPLDNVGFGDSVYGGFRVDLTSSNTLNSIKNNNITLNSKDDKLVTEKTYVKVPYRADNVPFAYKLDFISPKEAQACDSQRALDKANEMIDGKYGCSSQIVANAKKAAQDLKQGKEICDKPYADNRMKCSNIYKTTANDDVKCSSTNNYGFFRTRFDDGFEKAFGFVTYNGYNVVYNCVHKYSALDEATNTMVPIYGLSNKDIEKTPVKFSTEGANKENIVFSVMEANADAVMKESQIRDNMVFGNGKTQTTRDSKYNPQPIDSYYYDRLNGTVKQIKNSSVDISAFPTSDIKTGYGYGGIDAINSKMGIALIEVLGGCVGDKKACKYDPITLSPTKDYNAEVGLIADMDAGVSGIGNNFRVGVTKARAKVEPIYIVDNTTTDKNATKTKAVLKYGALEPEDAILTKPITNKNIVTADDHARVKVYDGGLFKNLADDKDFSKSKLSTLNAEISKQATLKDTNILKLGVNNNGDNVGYDISSKDIAKTSKPFKELSLIYFDKDKDLASILQPLNSNVKIIYDPKDNDNEWRGVGIDKK